MSGPYVWHEFDVAGIRQDFAAMRAHGIDIVRVQLPWDVFMPAPDRVPPARLRDVETLLTAAESAELRVVPVLFAQAFGDSIMLPSWAIDVSAPRRGVRVLTDAVVQPGGPRDQYTDPRMLDAALIWLEQMLAAFAGHPALHSWSFGHDPARVMRPRRIAHMESWVQTLSAHVHERGEACGLTLSSDDVTVARAVRPSVVAHHVDWLGCVLRMESLPEVVRLDDAITRFLAQLLQRMLDGAAHLTVILDTRTWSDAAAAPRMVQNSVAQAVAAGCVAVTAPLWAAAGPRALAVAPLDAEPSLATCGIVDADGALTPPGEAFRIAAQHEWEQQQPSQWPASLDVEDFYRNLPDSIEELFDTWKDGRDDIPGTLD